MILQIGNKQIKAKGTVQIEYPGMKIQVVDADNTSFLYINPDEVLSVVVQEKVKII